jgi:hypothetical protein
MLQPADCPSTAILRSLLAGSLREPEQAELILHLDNCAACQQRLEELAVGDRAGSDTGYQRGGRVTEGKLVLPIVRGEPLDSSLQTVRVNSPPDADRLLLSFLAPSDLPGYLGQLGTYEITEVIGRGGMGVVFKAFDPSLKRHVAIKVLAPQLATSADARERFAREARAAAAISHEHVVAIHAISAATALPYLVMEYVPGESLQERLDRTGPLEVLAILRIGVEVAAGLGAAHAQGLIHRDIKPANILLEKGTDRVKITDFGLARTVDEAPLTQSGVLAGTPHYMAPEQARGEPLDHRADLFSLGSVLYALCTGRPPFRAGPLLAVLRHVSDVTPPSVGLLNPQIPDWLAGLICRLHAKNPAERYASAAEVADLLTGCLAHVRQPTLISLPAALVPRPTGRRMIGSRRARAIAAVGLLGVLAACGLGAATGTIGFRSRTLPVEDRTELRNAVAPRPEAGPQTLPGPAILGATADVPAFRHPGPHAWWAAMSPSLKTLVSVSGLEGEPGKVVVWDLPTRTVRAWHASPRGARYAAYSPDGRILVTCEFDGSARLRDPYTGEVQTILSGHQRGVNAVAFSRDGSTLATAGLDGTVKLWDIPAGRERKCIPTGQSWVLSVAFSPDGKTLALGGEREAKLVDVATGSVRAVLAGHRDKVESVAFSPVGNLVATASWDGTVQLWDTITGSQNLLLVTPDKTAVSCATFSICGDYLCTAHLDGDVYLWRNKGSSFTQVYQVLARDGQVSTARLHCAAFSPDAQTLITVAEDGWIKLWDLKTFLPLGVAPGSMLGPRLSFPQGWPWVPARK